MHTLDVHSASPQNILSLDHIRSVLIRLEDTIVFQLIERAQFAHNARCYAQDGFQELHTKEGWKGSWLQWFLKETERSHAKVGRFESPEEFPFTDLEFLPTPVLAPAKYPSNLVWPHSINVNPTILKYYVDQIVPQITRLEEDGHFGSSAIRDIEVLSAMSRRIHFGIFVSESKFRSDPAAFILHIRSKNRQQLENLITKPTVEAALLVRLAEKAKVYGQDMDRPGASPDEREKERKIQVQQVVEIYQTFVIPLTKEVEVDYLITRLNGIPQDQIQNMLDTNQFSW